MYGPSLSVPEYLNSLLKNCSLLDTS